MEGARVLVVAARFAMALCTCALMATGCALSDAMDPPSVQAARRVLDAVDVPGEYPLVERNGLDKNSPYRDYKGVEPSELPAVNPPPGFIEDDAEPFDGSDDGYPVTVRAWTGEDQQLGVQCWVLLETPNPSPDPDALVPPLPAGTFRTSALCADAKD